MSGEQGELQAGRRGVNNHVQSRKAMTDLERVGQEAMETTCKKDVKERPISKHLN